jgi:Rrf2 family nitric oxide-sensitive transcriptional repressor
VGKGDGQIGISDTNYLPPGSWYRQYQFKGLPVRLLASTDFALRVLMRLAADPARHRSTEALAGEVGVPRNHLHKIIQDLAEAGIVRTLRGARGGVMLARPAAGITLGSVVRRLEAGQALVECFRPDGGACCLSPDCRLRGVLWQARDAFLATLDRTSLADCVPPAAVSLADVVVIRGE